MPRAEMSVAMRRRYLPLRKSSIAFERSVWLLSPWMLMAWISTRFIASKTRSARTRVRTKTMIFEVSFSRKIRSR